ncbi:hypothetical protein CU254_40560 [Amycolatopsis sp. AA4]|uniref:hypothetical protein n=1 Tax=Actinomycetes TaxID=1760 RepID=UPI0001B54128|nr:MULTISPECIES: hypothetical protein [Actinomycetes]ATY15981.1 hypothetical protein CU254_40560 [Amycolatopsis sp. AA4]EFL12319.1 predicted protein [Streptomyces sp. AA4]
MLRLAERRLAAPADRASGELVDRTGIIAASLPREPRPQDEAAPETSCESTQQIPVIAGCTPAEERPRAVASRRRARVWVGTGLAVILVGLGWLAGGFFTGTLPGQPADDAVVQAEQRVPIAEQQIPVPSTITPPVTQTAPPVTVYVPVPSRQAPVKRHNPVRSTAPRAAAPETSEQADPRADLDTPAPSKAPARVGIDQFLDWKPWLDAAQRMAGGH